ncbi:IS5 family transposase [Leeia sp. IMCC25680]|uniref:IS5 family transposase n=1 Tax=Leeia aquatica TaxID=2725557 RepID=A0A847S6A2_9NEIS|nr:IS5 family transposase [Leeia aquatica]
MCALFEPHYPKPGRWQQPFALETMLRIHFMQQWFALSAPAMEEARHDIPLMRAFAGLDAGNDRMPDETTILNFRHLLERHQLAPQQLAAVNALLSQQGLLLRQGTLVDPTLIAAPSSTKNQAGKRDPEMSQTKKGNQWYFGAKAHIGVNMDSGLIHSVQLTTAKVADIRMTDQLLHGEEQLVIGDGGYHRKDRTFGHTHERQGIRMLTPYKRQAGQGLEAGQRAFNQLLPRLRAKVEHPFRVLKQQFGYAKVRYRGLIKYRVQVEVLFALVNLYLARKRLLMG